MKDHYDFSKAVRNPHARRLKTQLTIRIDADTVAYFRDLGGELSLPYQTLMNMFLQECAASRRRPQWVTAVSPGRAKRKRARVSAGSAGRRRASGA